MSTKSDKIIIDCKRISDEVMQMLGRPPNFITIHVTPISHISYRVNIITSEQTAIIGMLNRHIKHSYYVTDRGDHIESDPPIKKLYPID